MCNDMRKLSLIATCKSTFAGSATIKYSFIAALSHLFHQVHLVTDEDPFQTTKHSYLKQHLTSLSLVQLDSIDSVSTASTLYCSQMLSELIYTEAKQSSVEDIYPIIWASHLFPYGHAALTAVKLLRAEGIKCKLVQFPVGSDIWEIGPLMPSLTAGILRDPDVNILATYSTKFAEEIRGYYGLKRNFEIWPPFIERNQVSKTQKERSQDRLGIRESSVVFLHLSNMRPVKCPQTSINIVSDIQRRISRKVDLLLVGPKIELSVPKNISVIQTGLVDDITPYIQPADYCINTSIHDAFNRSLLECMSLGVIPITTSSPAIADFIRDYNAGFVIEVDAPMKDVRTLLAESTGADRIMPDNEAISQFVSRSISDDLYRNTLQRNMASLIRENFETEVVTRKLQKFFHSILDNSHDVE